MKRTTKTMYVDTKNRDLISVTDGKATIECYGREWTPESLRELAEAAAACAEEVEAAHPVVARIAE